MIANPPVLYGVAFVLGLAIHSWQPNSIVPPEFAVIGLLVLVAGSLLAVWGKRTLEHAGTNASPWLPTTVLVVTGPFRFSRNPLYLARTLMYVGLALVMNTVWPLVALIPLLAVLHFGVISPEERYLDAKFGDTYRGYRARVRRWF